jgi:hypothetical protein
MSSHPRPILKHSTTLPTHLHRNAVHFPPSPSLTRTFSAYSSTTYDRSPIVVAPNSCAIPPRGCPGRTYSIDDPSTSPRNGRVLHPRALAHDPDRTPTRPHPPLPPLIPDLSSESDESDAFIASPSGPILFTPAPPKSNDALSIQYPLYPHPSLDIFKSQQNPTPLSFLPYPPSPPQHAHHQYPPCYESDDLQPTTRKRPQRRRDRSRDRDRIRTPATDGGERDDEDEAPMSPGARRAARVRGPYRGSNFGFQDADVGCLGGF